MSWRDDLYRVTHPDGRILIGASYRGVTFFVESSNRGGGRRNVVHEFPFSELPPFVADTGKAANTFSVTGYVLGADYVAHRNALISALEGKATAGTLIHPYYGTMTAAVGPFTVSESIADGGIASFSIEFTRTSVSPPAPTAVADHPAIVDAAADDARDASLEEMETTTEYDVDDEPNFSLTSLSDEISAISDKLGSVLPRHVRITSELAALSTSLRVLKNTATTLIRTPAALFDAFADIFSSVAETLLSSPRDIMLELLDTIGFVGSVPDANGATATRVLERANQAQLRDQIKRILIAKASQLAAITTYETVDDAESDSAAISGLLDEQTATATATSYHEIAMLKARMTAAVPGAQVLAEIVTINLPFAQPALLVAYRQYGSVALEPDILARNNGRYPSILSGDLSVRSDV